MAVQSKPIPALYVVYILRSTVRHASLYIGSTPNPPRRLNQHNGKAKGGAARTAKARLQPWEMVGIVSGFPSMVGALKFEWALNNPHVSLHIAPEERLTISTQRKRNGQPRRPVHSMTSVLSNLHLLLRVPSFCRWPLKLHFFDEDVYKKWTRHCTTASNELLRSTLEVVTDFKPAGAVEELAVIPEPRPDILRDDLSEADLAMSEKEEEDGAASDSDTTAEGSTRPVGPSWGIHALPLDHTPLAPYLEKGQGISTFEREGSCVVCHQQLDPGLGIYAVCPADGCEGVGHLDCWSRHLLRQGGEGETDTVILPVEGRCPECGGTVRWGDMMRELTLRIRGQKEVDKVLRKSRRAAGLTKTKTKGKTVRTSKTKEKTPSQPRAGRKQNTKATSANKNKS